MYLRMLLIGLFFISSCSLDKTKNFKNEKPNTLELKKEDSAIHFRFFHRGFGSNNYYVSNQDKLIIEQFDASKLHIRDLISLATKYRDTARSENPISTVELFGEEKGQHFDLKMARVYEFDDYLFLWVNFENSMEENKDKVHPKITSIILWRKRHSKEFLGNDIDKLINDNATIQELLELNRL